jgi:hypothetical protein
MRIDSLRKQRLALLLTTAACLTASVVLGFTGHRLWSNLSDTQTTLAEEREASQTRLREVEADLMATRKALKTAHASIGVLVEKRIPGLQGLQLDQVISIEESAVRDITFTRLRGSEKSGYEFKAVIENTSPVSVFPAVSIVLFDDLGVQVGRSQIGPEIDGEKLTLRPGEIRSHFAVVEVDSGRQASYFRLEPIRD